MTEDITQFKANWSYPTQVLFGVGRIDSLARSCQTLGMNRPLLVTDPGLADLPIVKDAVAANEKAGVPTGVFSNIKPNPVGHNVADGVVTYRNGQHDGVIAFGGGSALDAGKAIAFMVGQNKPIWEFEDRDAAWRKANPTGIAPIIAVPTTAGTGSETGRASVILDEDSHSKKIIFHPKMLPTAVISDPALTVGLPPQMTAATGMDALAHCLEAYCAVGFHPMAEGVAVEGMRLIHEALPKAYADGSDLEARAQMLAAASMGSTAFQKGLGAIHSLSHPIGALYDTHHGLTNAVLMPYVLSFNRPAIEDKMKRLAAYLGLKRPSFKATMDWILELRETLEIPNDLSGLELDDSRIDEIAEMAAKDPTAPGNPVPVGVEELRGIVVKALEGKLS